MEEEAMSSYGFLPVTLFLFKWVALSDRIGFHLSLGGTPRGHAQRTPAVRGKGKGICPNSDQGGEVAWIWY